MSIDPVCGMKVEGAIGQIDRLLDAEAI